MSISKNIILMRHAESLSALHELDINRELSAQGVVQAEEASTFLAKFNIDKLLISPSNRTIQTLNICGKQRFGNFIVCGFKTIISFKNFKSCWRFA